ncbi:MAG TPA: DUF4398 domain-containing protein [Steroidobacteraceae bacterium]|nr:DUF4398 domain-containing protein [Steroidobacteraceae bacterium]
MGTQSVRRATLISTLLSAALLCGCASAPVQEMSNARQALRAAQDAGAATKATATFTEAQIALNRAEGQLNKHLYRSARRSAEEAHKKAVEALTVAREQK